MNTKKTITIFISIAAVWMAAIACGIGLPSSPKTEAPSMPDTGATTLWPDVPPFPDATPDATMNLFFSQVPSDAMKSLVYYTDKQPADVASFYTDALMKAQGWVPQTMDVVKFFTIENGGGPQMKTGEITGCYADVYQGQPRAFCEFTKTDDQGQDVELTITASPDEKTNQTMLTYVRMVGSSAAVPTP